MLNYRSSSKQRESSKEFLASVDGSVPLQRCLPLCFMPGPSPTVVPTSDLPVCQSFRLLILALSLSEAACSAALIAPARARALKGPAKKPELAPCLSS